jgi:membrane protein DedA with SNARE-associated domain
MVIAAAAALQYPIWRIALANFISRGVRFAALCFLAIHFGRQVLQIARSAPFEWTMIGFTALCAIASGFSLWKWFRKTSGKRS